MNGHTATLPISDYEQMRVQAARYEYVRALSPQQYADLWEQSMKAGPGFDALVDAAIVAKRNADKSRWLEEVKKMPRANQW